MKDYRERYSELIDKLRMRVIEHYGKTLVSLALFGSVARGIFRPDSDIDILIVVEEISGGRARRVMDFQEGVEEHIELHLREVYREGIHPFISPVIKTREEVGLGSLIFLDMIGDAKILFDRDGFFKNYLKDLDMRLRRMGTKRVDFKGGYYWVLKPDYKWGDLIEI